MCSAGRRRQLVARRTRARATSALASGAFPFWGRGTRAGARSAAQRRAPDRPGGARRRVARCVARVAAMGGGEPGTPPRLDIPAQDDEAEHENGHLAAVWKMCSPGKDKTGGMSMQQELMKYIPPVEGATTTRFNRKKSPITEYLNKAIQLQVDLKSTSH